MDSRIVKRASTFFAEPVRGRIRRNISRYEWAKETARLLVEAAEPWRRMSDDDLWALMFGPTLPRSWMVWSNGYCPACKQPVPMYDWLIQPWKHPWKVQCPHCKMLFPPTILRRTTARGWTSMAFSTRSVPTALCCSTPSIPNPTTPCTRFGVDDGTGYAEGENPLAVYRRVPDLRAVEAAGGSRCVESGFRLPGDWRCALRAEGRHPARPHR
jgi:hypothetical protein